MEIEDNAPKTNAVYGYTKEQVDRERDNLIFEIARQQMGLPWVAKRYPAFYQYYVDTHLSTDKLASGPSNDR